MKIKILVPSYPEGIGRSGFQIEGLNKKHLECYIPNVKGREASLEEMHIMHATMNAMVYIRKRLKKVKYILFKLPKMPSNRSKEWKIMDAFIAKLANRIGCRVEYMKVDITKELFKS